MTFIRRYRTGVSAFLLAIVVHCFALSGARAASHPLWCGLEQGEYDVGFRAVMLLDHSRPYRSKYDSLGNAVSDRARPIRLYIWYPATNDPSVRHLTYGEYLYLESFSSEPWRFTDEQKRAGLDKATSQSVNKELFPRILDSLLEIKTAAIREAPVADSEFPLLIFGFGGTATGYVNSILCEYLASNGYVAVSIPALPRREGETLQLSQVAIDLQLRDIAFAIDYLYEQSFVDHTKLGLVSLSSSGVAHALMQRQNSDVDVLVSLDGATGYQYGIEMIRESIYYDSSAATVPYFHAHGLGPVNFDVTKDFTYFDSLASGPAYRLMFEHLSHPTFRSQAIVEHQFMPTDESRAIVADYHVLGYAVLYFLDAYLNELDTAESRLMALNGASGLVIERKR